MIKVGLTGGIGSGKSTVARVFEQLGVPIYDADSQAKRLINSNQNIIKSIKLLFGEEAYVNFNYNKEAIAHAVFKNKALLAKLNAIVHPAVKQDFENWCSVHSKHEYCIKEAAIMEKNSGLDKIIVVISPIEMRVSRLLSRDAHRNEADILKIIENQKSDEEYEEISDFTILNNENTLLLPQILKIHQQILNHSKVN